MANFIVNMLLSMVMSKKARQNLKTYRETEVLKATIGDAASGEASRKQAIANMKSSNQGLVTEDRAELIRHAMEVRKAKQSLIANLDDEQRQKLMALALKLLMKEETPPKG